MLRIATFGGVQPAALAELTEVLNGLLDGQNLKRSKMGGVRTAAEIINLMKTQQEEAVITAVREFDGELAQKIIDEMFLFENLVDVDDRSIQRLLQEVDSESLLIALKGAEQPLREKFLRNMSQRAPPARNPRLIGISVPAPAVMPCTNPASCAVLKSTPCAVSRSNSEKPCSEVTAAAPPTGPPSVVPTTACPPISNNP